MIARRRNYTTRCVRHWRMSARTEKPKADKVLLEVSPRSAVDRIMGVDSDLLIERGERKYFTKAEAESLLLLERDGVRVLQTCEMEGSES